MSVRSAALTTTVQTIQVYDPTPYTLDNNVILAGALGGVYALNVDLDAPQPSQYSWTQFGQGLPNVAVTDLDYVAASADLLLAGTLGRGAWEMRRPPSNLRSGSAERGQAITATNGTILAAC